MCSSSIMVWAAISMEAFTELLFIKGSSLIAQRYTEEILTYDVVPFALFIGADFVLLKGNARPHSARYVSQHLAEIVIRKFNWPACFRTQILSNMFGEY